MTAPPCLFQSTRPVRGATAPDMDVSASALISIHAPRAGRDWFATTAQIMTIYFNPRAPCGARRPEHITYAGHYDISIHAPRAGRDR